MTNNNITYVSALNTVLAGSIPSAAEIEKLTTLRDSIVKRNAKPSKPTKKELERREQNAGLAEVILATLAQATEPLTVTAMREQVTELGELSAQKVSSIVRDLLKSGQVKRETVKSKAVFSIA